MKQTAVEFAVEKLAKFIPSGNQLVIHIILEQAKELEKQQIQEAFYRGIQEQTQRNLFKHPELTTPEIYYKNNYE